MACIDIHFWMPKRKENKMVLRYTLIGLAFVGAASAGIDITSDNFSLQLPSGTYTLTITDGLPTPPPVEPPPVDPPIILPPGNLAAALADLQPGEWRQVGEPLSSFLPLRYRSDYGGGINGAQSILESWNSCAEAGGYFACWGGGHADGGYTGVYAIDLSTGDWVMLGDEYPYDTTEDFRGIQAPRPTLAPPPTHTYNGMVAIGDKLYIRGQHRYAKNVAGMTTTWLLDPGSATAVFDIQAQTWSEPVFIDGALLLEYNATKNLISDENGVYDAATQAKVSSHTLPRNNNPYTKGLRYDKQRDVLWFWYQYGGYDLLLYRVDLDASGFVAATTQVATVVGGNVDGIEGSAGMDLGPDGRLYWWGNKGVLDIYDPEANTWEQQTAPLIPYVDTNGNTTTGRAKPFGKWRYIESLGVFIGLDSYRQAPFYYKPPIAQPAPPVVVDPPQSVDIADKQVVDGVLYYNGVNSGLLDYELRQKPTPQSPPTWGIPEGMGAGGEAAHIGLVTEYIAAHIAGDDDILPTVIGQADFDYPWTNPATPPYNPAGSHLAHWYWYPYLLTGDEKYLNKLREQVDWSISESRGYIFDTQPRGMAWRLVSLAELASVDASYKPILELTRQNLPETRPLPNVTHTLHRDELGFMGGFGETSLNFENPNQVLVNIWQESFILQALAHTVLLGHEEWRPILVKQMGFFKKLFEREPWRTILYQNLVVWEKGQDLSTLDKAFAHPSNELRNLDWQSNASRGRYLRAALAMTAVAGVPGAREFHSEFNEWFEQKIAESGPAKWWTVYDMNKHAMVITPVD